MKRRVFVSVAVVLVLVFALAALGCSSSGSSSQASTSSSSAASSSAAEPENRSVGEADAKGSTFEFTNKAGKDIAAIAVKASGEAAYPASLIAAGEEIASGETVDLLCPEIAGKQADFSVTLADGSAYELHQIPVYDIVEATMRLEGDIAYVEYENEAGDATSTLEAEKELAAQAAAAAAEAEAAAAAAAQAEAAAAQEAYSNDSGATYVDDSAVGSGSEEACIDDIVLR